MKTAAIPTVRVSPELRQAAEDLLQAGETLSGFVEEAIKRNIEFRQAQHAFIERGLASGQAAKGSGKYVSSEKMLAKLSQRIAKTRKVRSAAA